MPEDRAQHPEEAGDRGEADRVDETSADDRPVPYAEDDPIAEVRRSWQIRRRLVVVRRRLRQGLVAVTLLILVAIGLIAQTGQGQDLALRTALNRVQSNLSGQLSVDGVRSGTLLAGATLTGVRLDAADGRPFLTADSVVVRYSIPAAIAGGRPIRSTIFWGLDLEVSRYSREQALNVSRLLAEGGEAPVETAQPADRPVELGHIGIRESSVRVLTPAADPDGPGVVVGPDGAPLREVRLDGLDLDVEESVLTIDRPTQFAARLASFSAEIGVLDEPLVVEEVFGEVTYGERGVSVTDARFRLPDGLVEGVLQLGPRNPGDPWILESRLQTDGWMALSDIAWVDPRIPDGRFRGWADLRVEDGLHLDMRNVDVELEASAFVFDGAVSFADGGMRMRAMDVSANPVPLERLEPWIGRDLPLDGWLSGDVRFDGTLVDLTTSGRVTFVPTGLGGTPTIADFAGTVHGGDNPGASDFSATLDPLNYTVLDAIVRDFPWDGTGSGEVVLDGRVDEGLQVMADMEHRSTSALRTVTRLDGTFWRSPDGLDWVADADLEFRPLAVGLLDGLAPDLGLTGEAWGSVGLDGALGDLTVDADLSVGEGRFRATGRGDVRDLAAGYSLEVDAEALPLAELSARFPERTSWSGRLDLDGRGFSLDSMELGAVGSAYASRVGAVRLDTLSSGIRVRNGVLITDSLRALVGGVDVVARGRLGLVPERFGSSSIDFNAESLVGLRPVLMGLADSIMVREELTPLDEEFLRLEGVDPDTLPSLSDVRLDGAVVGAANLSGHVGDLDLGVVMRLTDAAWKENELDSARVAVTASRLPRRDGAWQVGATGYGILAAGRTFELGGFEADMDDLDGDGRIELVRRPGEHYQAEGSFVIDSAGGSIDVGRASIEIDEERWSLVRPAEMVWDRQSLVVDSLEIARVGADPMNLLADGTLTRGGDSDFRLRVSGLHAEQVVHVAQLEEMEVGGHLDLDVTLRGPAEAPRIESEFSIVGPRYGAMQLSRLEGTMGYTAGELDFDIDGLDGVRTSLRASGTFPLDLSLRDVEDRVRNAPMDVRLVADSLDAAIALSYVTALEGVVGTVSGDVTVSGTPEQPEPTGSFTLTDGAWSVEAIGVRHTGLNGEVRLRGDRTAEVDLAARGNGSSDVSGTIFLAPFSDPALDLTFTFDRFLAVSRADVEGSISGSFDLEGRYSRPLALGALTVDEGAIYVDELQRAAGVVDLGDPTFLFDNALAVDTTALSTQPLFAGLRNPFFDNLRVDVDLSVPRGTWLRSIDSDIEMSGELLVRYDRTQSDFVLIGELQAIRGSHRVLGRTFELDGGNISFLGRPGLNPDLNVQASSRIRRQDEPPLDVNAQVEGTLVQPVVTLTTDEAGLAEEDLVSYLVFGQPSGALGGRGGDVGRLGGSNVVSSALQGGFTFLGGVVTNQFASAVTRDFLDYFSVQQSGGGQSLGRDYVWGTQLEVGRYFGDDIFTVLVLRPWDTGPQDQNNVAGLRVEWALTDDYNVEGFLEDRFLRSGSSALGASSGLLENERIWGVLFFREWGYSPKRNSTEQN